MPIVSRLLLTSILSATLIYPAIADEGRSISEPQITIRHEDKKTYYEYRVNGILKEIKVVPAVGPAYYLVPDDGGGWIREERSNVLIPKWVIFKW
ncbi:MAG: DUF2782 domain-containing protein [Oleiphilaceae bacterium]|nr:DUF2782 domain-containing protein [Oleiphilaceae bacterium]